MTGQPVRSPGDETTLRILPLYLQAVYRFTMLDDELRIPLIPYGKIGLAWYLWRVTRPDGSTAFVDKMNCTNNDCRDSARGGTTGWQATLGLSIRAERLDAKAAQALAEDMGIEHAGFFFEVAHAKVEGLDALGLTKNLRVGDTTWLAGINFEF
jgi:hypothetical protein